MASYSWVRGSFSVPAQQVGEYLNKLEMETGALTPALLVEMARKKESPIRDCFDWDNKSAAESYRLVQAREILRFLVVRQENAPSVRAFLHVEINSEEEEGPRKRNFYISTGSVMESDAFREYVLKEALQAMGAFRRKYENLVELTPVVDAMRDVETEINQKLGTLKLVE